MKIKYHIYNAVAKIDYVCEYFECNEANFCITGYCDAFSFGGGARN